MYIRFIDDLNQTVLTIYNEKAQGFAIPAVNDTVDIAGINYRVFKIHWTIDFRGFHPTIHITPIK